MRERIAAIPLRSRMIGLALVLVLVLAILVFTGAVARVGSPHAELTPTRTPPLPVAAGRGVPALDPSQSVALGDEIARLRALPPVAPAVSPRSITAEAARQPDLYAGEFVKHLLTQDYRTPRAQLLTWVQSEAAQTAEPLVTALVPPQLRDKWAVFSVTDPADGMAPIPATDEWIRLAQVQGHTTVVVQRVSEPLAWSSAVSSGRITDAGVTGREVTALVTLHTVQDGRAKASVASVALTLNLEGPPVRPGWGFVTVVTYTQIPVTPR